MLAPQCHFSPAAAQPLNQLLPGMLFKPEMLSIPGQPPNTHQPSICATAWMITVCVAVTIGCYRIGL
eukprot:scaffold279978_cov18-Tisochrysis_lutea.AAC.1